MFEGSFVALVNVFIWLAASNYVRTLLPRIAIYVWCAAMAFAALAPGLIAYTDLDPLVLSIGRWLTPTGWSALAIIAASWRATQKWTP